MSVRHGVLPAVDADGHGQRPGSPLTSVNPGRMSSPRPVILALERVLQPGRLLVQRARAVRTAPGMAAARQRERSAYVLLLDPKTALYLHKHLSLQSGCPPCVRGPQSQRTPTRADRRGQAPSPDPERSVQMEVDDATEEKGIRDALLCIGLAPARRLLPHCTHVGAMVNGFDVGIYAIRRRPGRRRPFEVRWRAAGRVRSRSFLTRALADSYRAELVRAARTGLDFDPATGEPAIWRQPEPVTVTWYEHAVSYAAARWPELAAHSRSSLADALATITPALSQPDARKRPDPRLLRTVLYRHAFNPSRPAPAGTGPAAILDWAPPGALAAEKPGRSPGRQREAASRIAGTGCGPVDPGDVHASVKAALARSRPGTYRRFCDGELRAHLPRTQGQRANLRGRGPLARPGQSRLVTRTRSPLAPSRTVPWSVSVTSTMHISVANVRTRHPGSLVPTRPLG
jgi:hypothetical protein